MNKDRKNKKTKDESDDSIRLTEQEKSKNRDAATAEAPRGDNDDEEEQTAASSLHPRQVFEREATENCATGTREEEDKKLPPEPEPPRRKKIKNPRRMPSSAAENHKQHSPRTPSSRKESKVELLTNSQRKINEESTLSVAATMNAKRSERSLRSANSSYLPGAVALSPTPRASPTRVDSLGPRVGNNEPFDRPPAVATAQDRSCSFNSTLAVATVLSQPEPYQDDNHHVYEKDDDRITRFPSVTNHPPTVVTRPTEASSGIVPQFSDRVTWEEASIDRGTSTSSLPPGRVSSTRSLAERGTSASSLPPGAEYSTPISIHNQSDSPGLVTATPIEAVTISEAVQVTIDEENGSQAGEEEREAATQESGSRKQSLWQWRGKPFLFIFLFVVVGIVLVIALPRYGSDELVAGPSATFDYHCYTSTFQLLVDQLEDVDQEVDTYILCPNTTIAVGTLANPEADIFHFEFGDYPIWPVHPGITIQCGKDGRSENNCTLDGGFLQVAIMPTIPLPPDYDDQLAQETAQRLEKLAKEDNTVVLNDITIRGITFTGQTRHTGPFSGLSVSVSQPGTFTFEDCHWRQMSLSFGLIGVSRNIYLILRDVPIPNNSMDVRIVDSSFTDIRFDAPLAMSSSQSLAFENCRFDRLTPSALAFPSCNLYFLEDEVSVGGGCAGLLYCAGEAFCSISNSCLQNSITSGPAPIFFLHSTTDGTMDSNFWDFFDKDADDVCEWALGTESFYANPNDLEIAECRRAFEAETCNLI